jgi:hypothetical protein
MGGADDVLRKLADGDDKPEVRAAAEEALARGKQDVPSDEWIHIWWSDADGQPLDEELYVVASSEGLVKAGYTDVRGEAGEEQFPRGPWEYDCLGSPGDDALKDDNLNACSPAE